MDFKRLFDIFEYQMERYPQKIALAHREGDDWRYFSTESCLEYILKISVSLMKRGLQKGDKLGLFFAAGSAWFNFLDFAAMQIGLVTIPIHANIRDEELVYILKEIRLKICFTDTKPLHEKLTSLSAKAQHPMDRFCLENISGIPSFRDLMVSPGQGELQKLKKIKDSVRATDLATVIYTSGTSGMPKGVMLSHANIVSNIKATITLVPVDCYKRAFSFLPLSHIFERMVSFTYIAAGVSLYYADHIENALPMMKQVKPHYFTCVPKLLERIYDDILEQSNEAGFLKAKLLKWALRLGENYQLRDGVNVIYGLKRFLANILVYRYWRNALGGKVEGVIVGAAALQAKLGRLFSAAGIEIREGYGLTETSPVIAFNRFEPGGIKFGTVGLPIPGIRIKIMHPNEAGEGEVWVSGPGVMQGYYNREALTQSVITEDGWFKTGDIGKFVHKRFLKITDRKKDIFKTSSGKYVAPKVLEQKLNTSPFIEQSFIVGFNKPFVAALILPNYDQLKKWCAQNKVHWTAPQYMALNPRVLAFMKKHIDDLCADFSKTERIRTFVLLHRQWSVETGEFTPTLKLKRGNILNKYQKEIEALYKK